MFCGTPMTTKKAPQVRKEEIFSAAIKCFNRNGYHKPSVDDIAAEVGITKGGVYYHFKSKKNLFIQLFHAAVKSYFEQVTAYALETENVDGYIRELVKRSEEVFKDNQDVLRFCLEFVWMSMRDSDIRKEVTMFYNSRIEAFSRLINAGMQAGVIKELDPQGVARTLYLLSMGAFMTFYTVDIAFDPLTQHAGNIEILFKGIQKNKTV